MIRSIHDPSIAELFKTLRKPVTKNVNIDGKSVSITKPFPSPADWRDLWMYQILIDRFNNPDTPPRAKWDGHNRDFFVGGTFNGVREKLDYLCDMGVRALWLSPVQKNCSYHNSYHGYAIQNFMAIDPRWASDPEAARKNPELVENELQQLIDEAHARGIYIIFDVVLHHVADVFAYKLKNGTMVGKAPYRWEPPYPTYWRDENGIPRKDWTDVAMIPDDNPEIGVWPEELRSNAYYHRRGDGWEPGGDFMKLKTFVTAGATDLWNTMIRCHEYLVGKFDVDGLRVDAFKHIDREFGRTFCTAIREFATSIGKKNFFIFCEVWDTETAIAQYVGRNTVTDHDDYKAADAALDFPLMFVLPDVAKALRAPIDLAHMYDHRRDVERHILSTHGEASKFFVTFLDNHDQYHRAHYRPKDNPHAYDDQLMIALGCLFGLQGIPCVYYGTEQGLNGAGEDEEVVRQALWGAPNPFDRENPFYQFLKNLSEVRANNPAMRYGRQYFRPISTDGVCFDIATEAGKPITFSRVLCYQEVVIAANPNLKEPWTGHVIVDLVLNAHGEQFTVLMSNKPGAHGPICAKTYPDGKARYITISLQPGEIQILSNRN